ncbi:MAG: aldehyde ferredoxin oxidoreductase C-terminal domain-containing protein [Desulfobacterales bacterium]|nr:aldehyde ferredoxin oxidoreductase C-terminal domain-containing protein [Desulfobacterales bacterium]MDD4071589.1 aldehyde ferredoxin oxidoreductase C-terminal domain-containing protein [Desulfobacterales bacterium]MDD4392625.1 aldehyde ferredoxin oxidoreductase C-terminal domain-containing protein [Desulfobacterales bacterium]
MKKILRVDMTRQATAYEAVPKSLQLFGGRGTVAKILTDEIDPACDPLSPGNKLIVCPGLFADTSAPCSGRISIGGKSPLTGTIKEANAGGIAAKKLAGLDIYAVIVEGKPDNNSWWILSISEKGAELLSANAYAGLNNYALSEKLMKDFGSDIGIVSIGTAGERGYPNSTVQITDPDGRPSRAAARGGLGAVMGSKKLKAIVIDYSGKPAWDYDDKAQFVKSSKAYSKGIMANPISGQAMPALGTAVLVNATNAGGILPTRNFKTGKFDQVEAISGEHIAELQAERGGKMRHACHPGCVIQCSNIYNDKSGNYLTSGFEYETIALLGANCGISDIDTIARMDRMCDDFGLDTMETGCTIGVCMEAGKIEFGDSVGAIALVQEIIDGTEFGKLMGQGTEKTGKHLGVTRIPTVKGQSLAGYDPRGLKGTGVTYAVCPMGADHTAGNALGNPTVDPTKKEGQVALSTQLQVGMALFDNLGMCIFSGFCTADPENLQHLVDMFAAKFGGDWNVDKLMGIAVQTLIMEKQFNTAAGFTEKDNRLPEFMYTEKLDTVDTVFDITDEELKAAIPF